jgi:hypothetical protein
MRIERFCRAPLVSVVMSIATFVSVELSIGGLLFGLRLFPLGLGASVSQSISGGFGFRSSARFLFSRTPQVHDLSHAALM